MTLQTARKTFLGCIIAFVALGVGIEFFVAQKITKIFGIQNSCSCATGSVFSNTHIALFILGSVFVGGVGVAILYAVLAILQTRRMAREIISRHIQNEANIFIFSSNKFKSGQAFSFGFFRPAIAIEKKYFESLTPEEREAVISHERYHVRNRDPFVFFLLEIAKRAFFYMPILRDLISLYRNSCELSADTFAKRNDALGRALLKLQPMEESNLTAVPFAAALRLRIERILHPAITPRFIVSKKTLIGTLALFLAIGFIFQAPAKANAKACAIRQAPVHCPASSRLFDSIGKTSYTP